jgi:N-acetylglucosamine transport system substrate-binding protein
MNNTNLTRRKFIVISGGAAATAALAACASPTPTAAPKPTDAPKPAATQAPAPTQAPQPTAAPKPTEAPKPAAPAMQLPFKVESANPLGVKDVTVDGVFFSGGFGHDYIIYAGKIMEANIPGVKVNVKPIQKVSEELRPRFVGGNPPDVVDNSGAGMFNNTDLVNDKQLADLAELMESPSLDTPGAKFKDTLFAGSQVDGVFDGKQYYLNAAYTVSALWHDAEVLKKYADGKYPETWDDFLKLCDNVKKDGKMSPFTYQGKYPYYMWGIVWNQLVYKAGGNQALVNIDNLEANAWKAPEVLRATEAIYQLWDKKYIMDGTSGLTHRESQAAWIQGKAAFLPCGTWLENEEKELLAKATAFKATAGGIPGFKDGKGDINAVAAGGGESFWVPSKAKNVKAGMEFLRVLLSRSSAKWFAENVSSIMPVKGITDLKASSGVNSAIAVVNKAGNNIISFKAPDWYSGIGKEIEQRMGELLTGKINPAGFLDAMQKKADATAKDPDVKKFKRTA